MTAETDIAAIDDGGANTAAEVRTALTSVLERADRVHYATSGSAININSTSDVTLVTHNVTGVAAGDSLLVNFWGMMIQNSGASRLITTGVSFGGLTNESGNTITTGATERATEVRAMLVVINASNARSFRFHNLGGTSANGSSSTGSDLTGTVTVAITMRSNSTTTTQTIIPSIFEIRHLRA